MMKISAEIFEKLNTLSNLKTFIERTKFCKNNFHKLGAGSARAAYELNNDFVLKLAKNQKGIFQNEIEMNYDIQSCYGDILAKIVKYDENAKWIIAQKAFKIKSKKQFQILSDFSPDDIQGYLAIKVLKTGWMIKIPTQEIVNQMENNLWIQELLSMCIDFDLHIGDINRISSWGFLNNKIVLIDYGVTETIYNNYYKC